MYTYCIHTDNSSSNKMESSTDRKSAGLLKNVFFLFFTFFEFLNENTTCTFSCISIHIHMVYVAAVCVPAGFCVSAFATDWRPSYLKLTGGNPPADKTPVGPRSSQDSEMCPSDVL